MKKETRLDDLQLGILVLTALVLLALGTLWLAGMRPGTGGRVAYQVHLDGSGGLQPGAAVRVAGVRVGRVRDVTLDAAAEWPVTFQIGVDREIVLHDGASATIASPGIFGDPFLAIDPGQDPAPRLAEGATIYGRTSPGMQEGLAKLDELGSQAGELLAKTGLLMDQISAEVTPLVSRVERLLSDQNLDSLEGLLADLRGTMDETQPRIGPLLDQLQTLTAEAGQALDGVPQLSAQLQSLTADLQNALGPDGERLIAVMDTAQDTLDEAGGSMALLSDNRVAIERSLADLQTSLRNMVELSQTLKEKPYSLIRVKPEPDRRPGDR